MIFDAHKRERAYLEKYTNLKYKKAVSWLVPNIDIFRCNKKNKGERQKMKFAKSKTAISLIALFLMLTFAVSIVALPVVNAATNYFTTWLYVASSASAAGVKVGMTMVLVAWTADMPPDTGEILGVVSSPTGRAGWHGMKIQVWDPDNETEVLDMPYSDPVGANWINFIPTKVGTYRIQAIFPYTDKEIKTTLASGGSFFVAGDHFIYSAAVSPIATFEVLAEAPSEWIESPLPGDYWTRPIASAARQWYTLTGNWLGSYANVWPMGSSGGNVGSYGYGLAPESAHVLWSKPFFIGGLADERFGDINYQTAHYQGVEFSPTIILDGKIHWTPRYTTHSSKGWEVIDLYSGETLYKNFSDTKPSIGQILLYESPNQHGELAYLWETGGGGFFFGGGTPVAAPQVVTVARAIQTANLSVIRTGAPYKVNRTATPISTGTVWRMVDAVTFQNICWIGNVSATGTQVYGKDGSILYYNMVNYGTTASPNYRVTVWNSSGGTMVASQSGTGVWQWRPAGGDFGAENPYFGSGDFMNPTTMDYDIMHNGALFYTQNFTIPNIYGERNALLNETGSIRAIRQDDFMIVGTQGRNDKRGIVPGFMMGINLKAGQQGTQLWKTTFTPPFVDIDKNVTTAGMFTGGFSLLGVYPEDNIMVFGETKQLKVWVYDLKTGKQLWTTGDEIPQYNFYGQSVTVIDHKVIIYGGYAGTFFAHNATTGELIWRYDAENVGQESPYGNYPAQISGVADGKIYTTSWEHSYTHPLIRGPNLRCINVTDGKLIWSFLDFGGGLAISDGIVIHSNSMDNEIYAHGKGPSATTVAASPDISVYGNSVMIKGTVTDQSPSGRRNTNDKLDWTLKGTPAISDEDMEAWMEYKFLQQVFPANAKGVEVTLDTIDPNGNFIHIGTVTSDVNGVYGYAFKPEVPGDYQIMATFAGSKSYGPSFATTYLSVDEAPVATEPPAYPQPIDFTWTIVGVGIAMIIAVAIAAVLILLRKK